MADARYGPFLTSPTGPAWKRIGVRRRAGVMIPLFSIHSHRSAGVGEFTDLPLLGDWAKQCGLSLIQLLPLNDMGSRFCPYDAESSLALDPMHLDLTALEGVTNASIEEDLQRLRKRRKRTDLYFDPGVKKKKLTLLKKIFLSRSKKKSKAWTRFEEENRFWLFDHAMYKVLKASQEERAWDAWPEALKNRDAAALKQFCDHHLEEVAMESWLQWQAATQLKDAAAKLRRQGIFLVGDLPFLVARDSADVWARPECFKLGLSAGAPPDLYFEDGQEWGMPPYDWQKIREENYDYLKTKLAFAQNFYDLYRIDHFVGLFRVWVFPREGEDRKKRAFFDPPEEPRWEDQAREILSHMLKATTMLPCAEDLGTVPDRARELLVEYGIPGMDIQRWMRDWKGSGDFLSPDQYRANAIATLSTHDMGDFQEWWNLEATTEDKERFGRVIAAGAKKTNELLSTALQSACDSAAIFAIHSFQDWLGLDQVFSKKSGALRINRPGIVDPMNWRLGVPRPLEEWLEFESCEVIRQMVRRSDRMC